jgi:hypothetical protein
MQVYDWWALFFCELHPMNIDINSPNHSVVNNFPHANLHVWVPSRSVSSYRLHQNDRIWSNMDGFEQCGVHPSHPTLDSLRVETSVFRVSPLWVCLKMGLPRSPQNLIVCHHISSVEGVINEVYIYILRTHSNPNSHWWNPLKSHFFMVKSPWYPPLDPHVAEAHTLLATRERRSALELS